MLTQNFNPLNVTNVAIVANATLKFNKLHPRILTCLNVNSESQPSECYECSDCNECKTLI